MLRQKWDAALAGCRRFRDAAFAIIVWLVVGGSVMRAFTIIVWLVVGGSVMGVFTILSAAHEF